MHDEHCGAAQTQTCQQESVFVLRRVLLRDVLQQQQQRQQRHSDLHRSLELAPQRQMLYEMMGRSQAVKGGGESRAPFEIL